jgi:hypothetical protein
MKNVYKLALCLTIAATVLAAETVTKAMHGTVTAIDKTAKTVTVKTTDGAEHTFKYSSKATVEGSKEGWAGVEKGEDVVVHYTKKGSKESALELDKLGKEGMKSTQGTVTKVDHSTKTITIKTADGTEQAFKMSAGAAKYTGKDITAGTDKASKVTVYYTEDAGKKVAHILEKL